MADVAELASRAATGLRARAFGVPLEFEPGVDTGGLRGGGDHGEEPCRTVVRLVPAAALEARWAAAPTARVREHRDRDGRLLLWVDHGPGAGYRFGVPSRGAFAVSPDGMEVLAAPTEACWADLLTGQILPLVATLRGLEVLHASAVVLDGATAVICAPSGVGKSSVAGRLLLRGAALVADDALALEIPPEAEGAPVVHPGTGWLQLRPEEFELLSPSERDVLPVVARSSSKVTIAPRLAEGSSPVSALYFLERPGGAADLSVEPVAAPGTTLLGATFSVSVRTPERLLRQLDLCARIAATVPCFAVRTPSAVGAGELAGRLAIHLAGIAR